MTVLHQLPVKRPVVLSLGSLMDTVIHQTTVKAADLMVVIAVLVIV